MLVNLSNMSSSALDGKKRKPSTAEEGVVARDIEVVSPKEGCKVLCLDQGDPEELR